MSPKLQKLVQALKTALRAPDSDSVEVANVRNAPIEESAPEAEAPSRSIFARYSALLNEKAQLEGELSKLKKKIGDMAPRVLDAFADQELENVKAEGRKLYPKRIIAAKLVSDIDRVTVAEALNDAGLGFLVTSNFRLDSVAWHFKEQMSDVEDPMEVLPPELAGLLELYEIFKVGQQKC